MMMVDNTDFEFENHITKIVVSQNIQGLRVSNINLGTMKEGSEIEVKYWIAHQLVEAGLASFHDEEVLAFNLLYKVHWRETKLQIGRNMSDLPQFFYPKLRRYLIQLKDKSKTNEYHNASRLAQDVMNCRLRKLVNLVVSQSKTDDILQKFSKEERALYNKLFGIISDWRLKILKTGAT